MTSPLHLMLSLSKHEDRSASTAPSVDSPGPEG